ncbi:MAG: tape measure protein, partial [Dehalococcoidales bacterium]
MALNIGQINFGVDANTRGLQRAIKQLSDFQKATDRVARSQEKGAARAATAMSRQETAIRKAFQQTINLQRELRKAGAVPGQIGDVTKAFRRLTKELTSGKITIVQFNRSVDAFNARLGRSKRSLSDLRRGLQDAKTGTSRFGFLLRDLESSAVLALGPLSGVGARVRSLGAIFGRSTFKLALLIAGIAGAIIAMGALGAGAVKAGERMKSLQFRFEAATGSAKAGEKALRSTIKLADKLGLEVDSLSKAYARFLAATQGTSIEGEKAEKIFKQVARAAAALKLETTEVTGIMRALEQIMSKGTVQAEELRGQLGDRLPGAFRIAAEAMGVTTRELNRMLKAGEVISDDFLPKFGDGLEKLGKTADRNLETLSGQWNRVTNNMTLALVRFDDFVGVSDTVVSLVRGMANALSIAAGDFSFLSTETEMLTVRLAGATDEIEKQVEPALILGKVYSDLKEDIVEVADALLAQQEALGFLGRAGDDIEFLQDFFEALAETSELSSDEIKKLAEEMAFMLQLDIEESAEGIAAGMAEMALRAREASEEIDKIKDTKEGLEEVGAEMAELRQRVEALGRGPAAEALFDDVTKGAIKFEAILDELAITDTLRNSLLAEHISLLAQQAVLEDKNAETLRLAKKAASDLARANLKAARGIDMASNRIEILRGHVAALAKGPDSLEAFTKVEQPLIRMRQALDKAGVSTEEIIRLTKEYREALEEQLRATDRFRRAAEQMSRAVVNSLEDIILKGGSVTNMLHDLAKELLRVFIRALFLDRLQAFLGGVFGGGGFPSVIPPPGGGKTNIPKIGDKNFAKGGAFKLQGSGGSDNIPFFGMGKAGETVTVSRADQRAGSGITIIQENHFHSVAAGPEIII